MEIFINPTVPASINGSDLQCRLAAARANHLIGARGLLTDQTWLGNIGKWQQNRSVHVDTDFDSDKAPFLVQNCMSVFPRPDYWLREGSEVITKSDNENGFLPLLELYEAFALPEEIMIENGGVVRSGDPVMEGLLQIGADNGVDAVRHELEFTYRQRSEVAEEDAIESWRDFDMKGTATVHLLDAERMTSQKPEDAHIILPDLDTLRIFVRNSMRIVDFDEEPVDFWNRAVEEFRVAPAKLYVAGGFR